MIFLIFHGYLLVSFLQVEIKSTPSSKYRSNVRLFQIHRWNIFSNRIRGRRRFTHFNSWFEWHENVLRGEAQSLCWNLQWIDLFT
jgi:hypothetical protein